MNENEYRIEAEMYAIKAAELFKLLSYIDTVIAIFRPEPSDFIRILTLLAQRRFEQMDSVDE